MANLEFHGGSDPTPILGGHTARKRWRKAAAATAAELMSGPPVMVCADERVSQAAKRLADSPNQCSASSIKTYGWSGW